MASRQSAATARSFSDSDGHDSDGHDSGDYQYESAKVLREYHERKLCGPECCGSPVQDCADGSYREKCLQYHKLWLCGRECCGKSPVRAVARARRFEEHAARNASALQASRDAAAAAETAAVENSLNATTVTDVHEVQLVVAYMRHFAEYCAIMRGHVTELYPFDVWKKVYADFQARFPDTRFQESLLINHMYDGLRKYRRPSTAQHELLQTAESATAVASADTESALMMMIGSQVNAPGAQMLPVSSTVAMPEQDPAAQMAMSVDRAQQSALVPDREKKSTTAESSECSCSIGTSVVTSLQVKSAAVTAEVGAGDGLYVMESASLNARNGNPEAPSTDALPLPGNPVSPATQSDLLDSSTSSDTEDDDQDFSQSVMLQKQSLKRQMEKNQTELNELKKQKLLFENLKLGLELGVITRAECKEQGHQAAVKLCK